MQGRMSAYVAQNVHTVHVVQMIIHQDNIGQKGLSSGNNAAAVVHDLHFKTIQLHQQFEQVGGRGVVIYQHQF